MQSSYPAHFERDMGCTVQEWLGWLPAAMGEVAWQLDGHQLHAQLAGGQLHIAWQPGPPRVIALMHIPRLHVQFDFHQVSDDERHHFMKRFDLYMQRGGG
mgnify:CR=1 FL=1